MNCEKIGAPTVKRFAKYTLLAALAGSLVAGPVHAQAQRDGYKFLDAVKERNGTEATQLLSEPGNVLVNSRDITSGESALHIVTQRRDPVWLRFLLAKGANPNIADRKGTTPLQLAAQLGFDPAKATRLQESDVHPAGCSYSLAENRIYHVQTSTAEETPDSLAICKGLELSPPSPPSV